MHRCCAFPFALAVLFSYVSAAEYLSETDAGGFLVVDVADVD